MTKTCRNCAPQADRKKEKACVFAIYTANVGGAKVSFCCENSAKEYLKKEKTARKMATARRKTGTAGGKKARAAKRR